MSKRKELERLVGELESGGISRRDFVRRAMAMGLSVSSVGALLSACGGGGDKGGQAGEGAAQAEATSARSRRSCTSTTGRTTSRRTRSPTSRRSSA